MVKLTEKAIEAMACGPGRKDRMVFDDAVSGLAIRIMASGTKTFLAQYTVDGRKRRVPIGRWGAITLEQARIAARGIFGDVARGHDVATLRTAARSLAKTEAAADKLTLEALLGDWDRIGLAQRRPSYRTEAVRAIKVAFQAHLSRRADALTRAHVVNVVDKLMAAGHATMASRTINYGRACYTWAVGRGKVPSSPFQTVPIPMATLSRDRVLNEAEVRCVWEAADKLGWPFGPLIRLLMLTVQRRDEVADMSWSEISADGTTWTIPKERAKNGKAHMVHLAPAARAILAGLPRHDGCDLIFTTNGKTTVSGFSRAKVRLDRLIEKARAEAAAEAGVDAPPAIPPWRVHDFRRTAVTWMAGNGVAPHVADRLLNHVRGTISGVAAVYQRGQFLEERKAVLESWAGWVVRLIEPMIG